MTDEARTTETGRVQPSANALDEVKGASKLPTNSGRTPSPCPATYVHWPHAWPLVAGAMSGHWCDGVIPENEPPCEADKCARKATAWHVDKSGVHWLACEQHRG